MSPSSRLPKMPQLTPKESLKNSSVLLVRRKISFINWFINISFISFNILLVNDFYDIVYISDMQINSPPSKHEQRELRLQQQQLLMQHHQQQLMEQQKKQREIEEEKITKHVEEWAPLKDRLEMSDDLSVQLKAVEELLEIAKSEDIVPAVCLSLFFFYY